MEAHLSKQSKFAFSEVFCICLEPILRRQNRAVVGDAVAALFGVGFVAQAESYPLLYEVVIGQREGLDSVAAALGVGVEVLPRQHNLVAGVRLVEGVQEHRLQVARGQKARRGSACGVAVASPDVVGANPQGYVRDALLQFGVEDTAVAVGHFDGGVVRVAPCRRGRLPTSAPSLSCVSPRV